MNEFAFLNYFASTALFISLLLACFLFFVKSTFKLANQSFAFFLILSAIDLSSLFVPIDDYPKLDIFRWTTSLLIMPLFFIYVSAACFSNFKLKRIHWLLLMPFFVTNLILTPRVYLANENEMMHLIGHLHHLPEFYFFRILFELQYFSIIVGALIILKKYKAIYLENYTNANNATYSWLFQMTIVLFVSHFLVISKNILRNTSYKETFMGFNLTVGIAALLIMCWFVLKALNHPELFRGIDVNLQLNKDFVGQPKTIKTNHKNTIATINNDQIALLKKYMTDHEPYLDPSLTIQTLAKKMNMPMRDLSILINHQMNQHFFDFINAYRIEKAMNLLKKSSQNQLTISEILYEVGFNSKSSFNASFKKYTKQTPTEYKDQNSN